MFLNILCDGSWNTKHTSIHETGFLRSQIHTHRFHKSLARLQFTTNRSFLCHEPWLRLERYVPRSYTYLQQINQLIGNHLTFPFTGKNKKAASTLLRQLIPIWEWKKIPVILRTVSLRIDPCGKCYPAKSPGSGSSAHNSSSIVCML